MKSVFVLVLAITIGLLVVSPAQASEKEWTWLVFLNADNNLDEYGVEDQNEMARVGSNEWLNIVTLIDRYDGPATLNYIEKNKITTVREMGELDMGDYKQLISFFQDVAAAYPAKHYGLVIWNHGSGWDKSKGSVRGISYDDSSDNYITTEQLGLAMAAAKTTLGRNLDLLCMDACLMQMMEVAWSVKDSCDFVVASEETEPGDGYPYYEILGNLTRTMLPRDFCRLIVKAYGDSYNHDVPDEWPWFAPAELKSIKKTTQSAIDCARLPAVKTALDAFAEAAMAKNFAPQFKAALADVQRFYTYSNIDLIDFVILLRASIKDEAFQAAAGNLKKELLSLIVANATTGDNPDSDQWPGEPGEDDLLARERAIDANGIAIYFPEKSSSFSAEYQNLAFARESLWDEMIQDYFKKSLIATVLAEAGSGNLDTLREYVKSASRNNREVSSLLVTVLNFYLFTETSRSGAFVNQARDLLQELLANQNRVPEEAW
ncbi:MAG: hypothetical protein ACD_39C01726G0002 [uncultured bacterium]|nr:MAG: hypothetical protein ACD_39C01726G0002 [uncultured bacterium]